MNYKKSVNQAIANFSRKHDGLPKKTRKKRNSKPEAAVVLLIKNYLESLDWHMTIIEGKANYSESAGRYLSGAVSPGYPDLSGNMPTGLAVYIEVKNTGKRSTLRPEQRDFLIAKIAGNCFAICSDSVDYTGRVYQEWLRSDNRKAYLLRELPPLAPRYAEQVKELDFG